MNNSPAISVLMPVYNGERYLNAAINSILNQTFTDFELIICNDCSTDKSENIINSYNDKRIVYLKNENNSGIVFTRNKLFSVAKGEFYAIMDCDDIAMPNKLKKQYSFLRKNTDYGICGTWAKQVNEYEQTTGYIQMPISNEDIKANLLFQSSFVQSTVLLRASVVDKQRYNPEYAVAEDYEFWSQIASKCKMHNIGSYELLYRWHSDNISHQKENLMKEKRKELIALNFNNILSYKISDAELDIQDKIGSLDKNISPKFFKETKTWIEKLYAINKKQNAIKNSFFIAFIWYRWMFWCVNYKKPTLGFSVPLKFYNLICILKLKVLLFRKISSHLLKP